MNLKIDVGCGDYKREGFIGVDIVEGENVDYEASAQDLPFEAETVDHYYSDQMFEHLEIPYIAMKEAYRVLKHGGIVEISIPNVLNLMRVLRWMKSGKGSVAEGHIQAWTLPEFVNLGVSCGLEFQSWTTETHERFHKLSFLEKILKKWKPHWVDRNLKVVFVK